MLKFKNSELLVLRDFLPELELSGKSSRGRNKLLILIQPIIEEFMKDVTDYREEFFIKDASGKEFVKDENDPTKLKLKDGKQRAELDKAMTELSSDEVGIDPTQYIGAITAFKNSMDDYQKPLSGINAEIYDILMDQLDTMEDE